MEVLIVEGVSTLDIQRRHGSASHPVLSVVSEMGWLAELVEVSMSSVPHAALVSSPCNEGRGKGFVPKDLADGTCISPGVLGEHEAHRKDIEWCRQRKFCLELVWQVASILDVDIAGRRRWVESVPAAAQESVLAPSAVGES